MASHGITIFIYILQQDSRGRKHLRARAGTLLYNSLLVMRRPSETFCSSSHCKLNGKTLPTCSFENALHLPSNTKHVFSSNDLYVQCTSYVVLLISYNVYDVWYLSVKLQTVRKVVGFHEMQKGMQTWREHIKAKSSNWLCLLLHQNWNVCNTTFQGTGLRRHLLFESNIVSHNCMILLLPVLRHNASCYFCIFLLSIFIHSVLSFLVTSIRGRPGTRFGTR